MTEGPAAQPPVDVPPAAAAPPAESAGERRLRYTRRSALYLALAGLVVAAVFLTLLVMRNTREVELDYVFGSTRAAVVWMILVSALTGWVLGIVTSYFVRRRTRRPR